MGDYEETAELEVDAALEKLDWPEGGVDKPKLTTSEDGWTMELKAPWRKD